MGSWSDGGFVVRYLPDTTGGEDCSYVITALNGEIILGTKLKADVLAWLDENLGKEHRV